uniref:cilia- and flagella-associated protein 144 n=1 Tax=Semicossyphus pulcher TaxID=241346 RepID=UPI0037E7775C
MAGNDKRDMVHQSAILVETIKKEQRHMKLHTEFGINPYRKLHFLPDKPLCRKPPEVLTDNTDYMEAFHKARQVPTKKYSMPQTESQEIGWWSAPLVPSKRDDRRFNFNRVGTDITKHKESALRSSN